MGAGRARTIRAILTTQSLVMSRVVTSEVSSFHGRGWPGCSGECEGPGDGAVHLRGSGRQTPMRRLPVGGGPADRTPCSPALFAGDHGGRGCRTRQARSARLLGSPEWQASYGRRAHVESIFGNLPAPSTQNIRRGLCRVMGLIKTTLMLAFEVMAANLRLVREWARATGENSDPLHEPFPEDVGVEEIDAEGNVRVASPDALSPPGS